MNENNCKPFILNNDLTAASAVFKDGRILATDGVECRVHVFDNCGRLLGCEQTIRPYRKLRHDTRSGMFTAISSCNRALMYCIDDNLNETGYTALDISDEYSCRNDCCHDDLSEMTDASTVIIGNERFFVGVFTKSAYLFDLNGKRSTRLCTAEANEILTDFIAFDEEKYAMSTLKNGFRTISVYENGITRSGILNKSLSLKMLFAENGTVYGLFSRHYIYNSILPIYSNGTLTLPDDIENCFCSC